MVGSWFAFAAAGAAQAPSKQKIAQYEKELYEHRVAMAGIYVNIAYDAHKAGAVPTASANYLRAAEVGHGQHQMADRLLASMREQGDQFWLKPRRVPRWRVTEFARQVREADRKTREGHLRLAKLAFGIGCVEDAREHCLQAMRLGAAIAVDAKGASKLDSVVLPGELATWLQERTVATASGARIYEPAAAAGVKLEGLYEHRSEALVVRSDLGAARCESLQALGSALLPHLEERLEGTSARQLVLLVFGKRADYDAYLKSLGIESAGAGLADYRTFQTIVCAEGLGEASLYALVLHELSHLFFFGTAPAAMPDWFAEGFAETFGGEGTFGWDGRTLTTGGLMERDRIAAARRVPPPLRDLLAADAEALWRTDRDAALRFYAQAWAFQRFLRSPDCRWRESFEAFEAHCRGAVLGAAAGKPADRRPAQAVFDALFAGELDTMEREFHAWLAKL